jgi:dienelactone hydrolase
MKTKINYIIILIFLKMLVTSSSAQIGKTAQRIKEETVTYTEGGKVYKSYVAYNESVKGKRPAVLVVHEWWGLNDYTKMRARKLAELGYIAMAVDMFGNGTIATNPTEAQTFTAPFYKDPQLAKVLIDDGIKKIKEYPQTDPGKIAAIGYCFGGSVVLNSAKLGSDLSGVVSFHGGLNGVPANKSLLKAKILVCHGGSDKFVSQKDFDNLKHQLDSIGADNTFKIYANATHAFTNPDATKTGKEFNMPIEYNAEADRDSWNDMKTFLGRVFGK